MKAWAEIYKTASRYGMRFFKELHDPENAQKEVLMSIVNANINSRYGRNNGFSHIRSIDDYQRKVPIVTYEQILPDIQAICDGESNVLTSEPVKIMERTGGSTDGAKLIPYTESSFIAFRNAIYPWFYDLLTHRKAISQGTAYWSISPSVRRNEPVECTLPIGVASDVEYFGDEISDSIIETLAVPPSVGAIGNFSKWQNITLHHLLAASDLRIISVWSPTYLLQLLHSLQKNRQQIIKEIHNHGLSDSGGAGAQDNAVPYPSFTNDRVEEIHAALQSDAVYTRILWPQLDTISCWLDASSARYRKKLSTIFPDAYIQGKGLLATEGVVSIPVTNREGCVLAINSGFYEFIDQHDQVYLAHELREGEKYRVIITTSSGLYRYDLGDRVQVTGYLMGTPLLRFLGRSGVVSDLCGEKLTEEFVFNQMDDLQCEAMLIPCAKEKEGYVLILEGSQIEKSHATRLVKELDARLCKNPQYKYAREIGQLGKLRPIRIHNMWNAYTQYQCRNGRNLGDIKPTAFSNDTNLYSYFTSI